MNEISNDDIDDFEIYCARKDSSSTSYYQAYMLEKARGLTTERFMIWIRDRINETGRRINAQKLEGCYMHIQKCDVLKTILSRFSENSINYRE